MGLDKDIWFCFLGQGGVYLSIQVCTNTINYVHRGVIQGPCLTYVRNNSLIIFHNIFDFCKQFSCSVVSDSLQPMDCSMPGLPVNHQLLEFTQTLVHWVSDAIQPSHPLASPSLPTFDLAQHQGLFQWISSSHQVAKVLSLAWALVLPMNNQDWFPLGWTGWISFQSKGLSRVFSSTTVQKHQFFALSFLYGPTLTSIHAYWKNHSFD